jgi:hypothetical protein
VSAGNHPAWSHQLSNAGWDECGEPLLKSDDMKIHRKNDADAYPKPLTYEIEAIKGP